MSLSLTKHGASLVGHREWATRRLPLPVIFVLAFLLVAAPGATALDYDLQVESATFEPGDPVYFYVTGPVNLTFTIRVVDASKDIVSGRDAQTDEAGEYDMSWIPTQSGTFNATVVFSTGLSISRKFLVQKVIDEQDLSDLYRALYGVNERLGKQIALLSQRVDLLMGLIGIVALVAVSGFLYVRHTIRSRANTSLEDLLEAYTKSIGDAVLKKKGG